ncbi:SRPBCC family protein [Paraburkholderia azotifigens]|uniref:Carbon monoxide dehydrogenase subunit G n=1 Tax=Paraburkholderia azotifigens TaxID=2057004 RepID=A0A5C6V509_9BURK|nr:carbon monoxide dehydrogenase subunit G [Paraburkholderia azotifigens]TXC79840.1 carbon monoxide dehydrogenase subunit G [Paraburkholderia azotifigens]
MELTGEQILPLPRERVWAALNDPEILKASVPGCESFERVDDNQFQMVMAATVGPIKARFKGRMMLTDLQPPQSYSMTFEGSGGAAGFGKGGAHVDLLADSGGTRLVYRSHAQVGGRLAQVGARLIDGVARKMAEDFFGRFTEAVVGRQAQVSDDGAAAAADAASDGTTVHAPSGVKQHAREQSVQGTSSKTLIWALGLVAVIALAAVYALH